MDKIEELFKKIGYLESQREEIEKRKIELKSQCNLTYDEIAKACQEFYTCKEFVLYEDFPSINALKIYLSRFGRFPLYEFGILNIKELAEIIKHVYQFRTGKEYNIFTLGAVETRGVPIYGDRIFQLDHIYIL